MVVGLVLEKNCKNESESGAGMISNSVQKNNSGYININSSARPGKSSSGSSSS